MKKKQNKYKNKKVYWSAFNFSILMLLIWKLISYVNIFHYRIVYLIFYYSMWIILQNFINIYVYINN